EPRNQGASPDPWEAAGAGAVSPGGQTARLQIAAGRMTTSMCNPPRADCPGKTGDSQDLAGNRGIGSGSRWRALHRGPEGGAGGTAEGWGSVAERLQTGGSPLDPVTAAIHRIAAGVVIRSRTSWQGFAP